MLENELYVYPISHPSKVEQISKPARLENNLDQSPEFKKRPKPSQSNNFDSLFQTELKKT